MSDISPMLDDEVEEGSPMGGGTCEDSSPEPMMQPSVEYGDEVDTEQNEENHFPFDSLAVELYEAPDEENASSSTPHEKNNLNVAVETYGHQNVQSVISTASDNAYNGQESTSSGNIYTESSKSSAVNSVSETVAISATEINPSTNLSESYQPSIEMKEESPEAPEPDYKELQKTYINDFYYSNVTPSLEEPCDTDEIVGLQLSRFNKIVKAVECCDYETLQTLYQLLYQRSAWDTQEILSQRILGFSGFNFGKNSEDYFNREMMLRTLPDNLLAKIATMISLDQVNLLMLGFSKNKMDLISRILDFLSKPQKKTRGPRTGGAEEDGVENASGNQSEKCGCRHRCLLKFSANDKKNLLDFLQLLREKKMFDSYIISLMTCKKIERKPSEDYKKLKEVLYTYKVKMANKEINACKGGFCLLHGIKMGKLNQLQNKLKTGKKLPTKLKVDLLPPMPASEIPDLGETPGVSKVIKRQSPAKMDSQEDQKSKETSGVRNETIMDNDLKEKINLKDTSSSSSDMKDEDEEEDEDEKKLKDFPLVVSSIEKAPEELLIDIHFLLFLNSADVDKVKSNILEFSGFSFDVDTEENDERVEFLQRMSNKIVADVARSFSLAVMPKKEDTIKNILSFLRKPDESYLRTSGSVPVILSDVELELDDIDGMSDSDESITCEVVHKKVECIDLISSGEEDSDEKSGKEKSKAGSPRKKTAAQKQSAPNNPNTTSSQPAAVPQPEPAPSAPAQAKQRCLRDFETICKIVNTHPHEYLIDIFDLLYLKKHEPSTLRNDILDFTGFTFEKGSSEYIKRKQLLDRMLYNSVRRIYNTLIHNTTEVKVFSKPTMIGEIFQFLFKLPDHDTSVKHILNKTQPKPTPVTKAPIVKSTVGSAGVAPVPVPPTSVPQGKLSDLKRVFQRVACFPCEYLIDVHKLLFMTDCDPKVIRQNIFGFKGFSFSADSPEFQQRKMYLEYLTFHSLRKISSVLTTRSVDLRNSTKHELATHLTQVLAEYTNTYVETEPIAAPTLNNAGARSGKTPATSSGSDVENIVITPIIMEPMNSSPPATPATSEASSTISSSSDKNAKNSATSRTCDDTALSISIVDARSVTGSDAATSVTSTSPVNTSTANVTSTSSNRRKRKQNLDSPKKASPTPSRQSSRKLMKLAPNPEQNQFADINLPEIEQYRKLYGQNLNIYTPTMPAMAGIAAFNAPGVVSQPFPHMVPQTLPFPLMHSYQPSLQVTSVQQASPVLGIQSQLENALAKGKQSEVIVPGSLESDSSNVTKGSSEISLTPAEKNTKISLISEKAEEKEDEEDCDKPLSSLIGHPIDSVLKKQILDIVKQTDLQDITINGVIQKIYSLYPKFDLSYRKEFIKSTLRSILYRLGDQNSSEKSIVRDTNSPDCSVTTTNIPDNTPEDTELISSS
ncbi:uncharacterized protein LOC129225919 [Uloborus diversus]|uniref:uncharacterized protein LOC129225919 n=1 Tax=Uloborus diversus TaxID=327109 RepID=UPI00240929EE|nr:uncharacterized protein LOC129225919 [Uloborus diversus]